MNQPINLNDWEFSHGGTIWGRLDSGQVVRTSPIVARNPEENLIQTRSGTIYRLVNNGGQGYSPALMWDANGWNVGDKRPIPRIQDKAAT